MFSDSGNGDDIQDCRSRRDTFLKSMEEKLDPGNSEQKERFLLIKNQILEKVKTTHHSRARSRSGSVSNRSLSSKRDLSSESKEMESGKTPVRPRISSIPLKQ